MKMLRSLVLVSFILALGCSSEEPKANNANNANNSNNRNNANNSNNSNNANNSNNVNNLNNANNSNNTNNTNNTNGTNTGAWTVDVVISAIAGAVDDTFETTLTLSNFTLDPNIGGANETNTGHYAVYLDLEDPDNELLRTADNPGTVTLSLAQVAIDPGAHNILVIMYQNDMTNYDPPVVISIPFTVN